VSARSITITGSFDWGCDHTIEDTEAYQRAVEAAVAAVYPGAVVEYTEGYVIRTRASADGFGDEDCRIEEEACAIAQRVFDTAEFWPAVSTSVSQRTETERRT
jgi:hypothetical protein